MNSYISKNRNDVIVKDSVGEGTMILRMVAGYKSKRRNILMLYLPKTYFSIIRANKLRIPKLTSLVVYFVVNFGPP